VGNRLRTISWIVFVLTPGTLAAQTDGALRLSLEEAQARAAAASHRLAEARAREAAAVATTGMREAADRPVVALGGGYTRTNHVTEFVVPGPRGLPQVLYPDVPDNYRTRLDLQWPIYSGGRADALERAARAEAAAAAADIAVAQADLRLDVARAFWSLLTARATSVVLEQSLSRAGAHLSDARQRFEAGLVAPNDVASAEAVESRQRMLLIEARNQEQLASAALARLVAVDLMQPIDPADALEGRPDVAAPLNALIAQARAARSERQALERRTEAAEQQHAAAQGGTRPAIAVTGGFDFARPNPRIFPRAAHWDDSWDAGVTVAWSLWDGGRARAEALQARGMADAARARLAEFDSILSLEVHQRLLEIDSGRAAIRAAVDAVRAAAEARRVVAERYRAGVIGQTEVLDADGALLQAELDRTRALAAVRLAEARLARVLGR
jgi:outer membrane protein TolC